MSLRVCKALYNILRAVHDVCGGGVLMEPSVDERARRKSNNVPLATHVHVRGRRAVFEILKIFGIL